MSVLFVVVTQQQRQGVLRLLGTACFPTGLPGAEPSSAHTAGAKATATPLATHHHGAVSAAPSTTPLHVVLLAAPGPAMAAAPVPRH